MVNGDSLRRVLHVKRIAMMSLMIGAMFLRNRVAQQTLIVGVASAAFMVLAIYTIVVIRLLERNDAGRRAVTRAIVSGILPIGSRLLLSRSKRCKLSP